VTHLSSNNWNGDDPKMWNPEARDSSPIIFTFMSSWETPPLPGRRGTRRACGREPLLDWMSWSWSRGSRCGAITSVRNPLPHSPGWRETRCRSRAAWKEGNKGCCRCGAARVECSVDLATRNLEDSVTSGALQSFLSRMVKRGGEYRWSCENLNGGLG
jgi:hypothetical protein